jgi:hypothetical protein
MPYQLPRVQVVPQPDDQVAFEVDGRERLRWHFGRRSPRPFLFPLLGPGGRSVTRLGHPAAPDHDHHRSLWLGHHDVGGVNFWEERGGAQQIRQDEWVHYQDGADEAALAVRLGWYDAHGVRLLRTDLILAVRPLDGGATWLEAQLTFRPALDGLPLGKTNFGFLGLRVAASLSAHYGGGRLTGSGGGQGEAALFAKAGPWMDYSGPLTPAGWEGVTWFDHPSNPNHPTSWHVRDDGWMSAAFNLRDGGMLRQDPPLVLRYGWHVHGGDVDVAAAGERFRAFAATPAWELAAAERPWRWRLRRVGAGKAP